MVRTIGEVVRCCYDMVMKSVFLFILALLPWHTCEQFAACFTVLFSLAASSGVKSLFSFPTSPCLVDIYIIQQCQYDSGCTIILCSSGCTADGTL